MKDKVLGVDIGGTKIRAILWNGKKAIKEKEIKTPKSLAEFKKALIRLVKALSFPRPKLAIAVPGRLRGNIVVSAANLPYIRNLDLGALLRDFPPKADQPMAEKIKMDHDARCFLRAEVDRNKLLKKRRVLGLTLGTGIGRAFAKDGKILKIKNFEYPERWEIRYQKVRNGKDNQALADFLAEKLKPILAKYSPDIILIGGGVARRKNFFTTFQHSAECWNVGARIIKSKLGQNSVAIGAALLYEN